MLENILDYGLIGFFWICKFAILVIALMAAGMGVALVIRFFRLTPVLFLVSGVYLLGHIYLFSETTMQVAGIAVLLTYLISIIFWMRCFINKKLRRSKFFNENKLLSMSCCVAIHILVFYYPYIDFYPFTFVNNLEYKFSICYVSLLFFSLGMVAMMYEPIRALNKLKAKLKKQGVLYSGDAWAIAEEMGSNDESAEEMEKRGLLLSDLLEQMAKYDNLITFVGENITYYFSNEKFIEIEKKLYDHIEKKHFIYIEAFYKEKDLYLCVRSEDIKIFLNTFMWDICYGHYDNKEIITINSLEDRGLCDYCKKYSEHLIKVGEEQYCSSLCADSMAVVESQVQTINRKIIRVQANAFSAIRNTKKFRIVSQKQGYYMKKKQKKGDKSHGFAAEIWNTEIDKWKGKDTILLGANNAKHGPDRAVNGEYIQSKYCKNADSSFKAFYDSNGNDLYPELKKEVPRDQIKEVRQIAIIEGKDPMEFVAGNLSYNQAVNVTKFLRVESLLADTYDSAINSINAEFGWSGMILLFSQLSNGASFSDAIQTTTKFQIESFKNDMIINVTSNQLFEKTNIGRSIIKKYGSQSAELGVVGLSLVINNHRDFQLFFDGQISGKRLTKKLTASGISAWLASIVNTKVGASQAVRKIGESAIGSIMGVSCIPGLLLGGLMANVAYNAAIDILRGISKKDMEDMERIFNKQFEILAKEYLLFDNEIEEIYAYFKNEEVIEELFLEMYRNEDHFLVSTHFIMSRIVEIYNKRTLISLN
ncbi:MAG: hypothetical protein AB9836_06970 [Aminipila sp.]